jgi:hypothetical protein
MRFKIGERVIYVIDSKIRHGVIDYVISDHKMAIVKSDDGEKVKVFFEFLAPEPTVEKTEPIEKPEITITPEEFRETAVKVFKELGVIPQSSAYDVTVFTAELHKALFFNEVNENP